MKATIALPSSLLSKKDIEQEDMQLLKQELNVKEVVFTEDAGSLGEAIAMVDARKVGPRMGKKVQSIIQAGKAGEFTIEPDGMVLIQDEKLSPEEVSILYRGREGEDVLSDRGIIVSLNTNLTQELIVEGHARDLIRAIQKLRKENGYSFGEKVTIDMDNNAKELLKDFKKLIEVETNVTFHRISGEPYTVQIDDELSVIITMKKAA